LHFVSVEFEGRTFIGLTDEAQKYVLDLKKADEEMNDKLSIPTTLIEGIKKGNQFVEDVSAIRDWVFTQRDSESYFHSMDKVKVLAPIPRPPKNILCVGKNYKDHVLEMGNEGDIPEHIMIFTKAPTAVVGHREAVELHEGITSQLDYEGELAVVMEKEGREISESEAMDYIFGFTIVNDITARDLQSRHKQFFLGKSLDGSCPMGPVVVHKSVIENPHALMLTTKVNGEVRQEASTSLMIFSIPEIISTLSKGMTLQPGVIIATGTPCGVGKGFKPPRFLKKGDVVEVSVEKIGSLVNRVE
jgi:2-keto-4-pentenoate hydratase/2-oxohepta-3-ene-1,7-dioic acid hydratase in catechol pathway